MKVLYLNYTFLHCQTFLMFANSFGVETASVSQY